MPTDSTLERLLSAVLTRYLQQNGERVDAARVAAVGARCAALVTKFGVPAAVASEAENVAGRLSEAEVKARAAYAAGPDADGRVQDAAKQLVKALFYPELAECRLSFEAVTADGRCKRQELERARERVSGTHCVDCPHWRMGPEKHAAFLAARWREDAATFAPNQTVFLPEDFRALRHALRVGN